MSPRAAVVAAAALAWASLARAAPDDACMSIPVEGQMLERAGKLLEARARFERCASDACPQEIAQHCARWLTDVEGALPSVVVAARDAQGRDLLDVTVVIDGAPVPSAAVRAVLLDPGPHTIAVRRAGSADVTQSIVLREGEKNRSIAVTLAPPTPTPARESPPPPAPDAARRREPIPAGAWIAAAVGAAGLASFGAFGALGLADRSSSRCDAGCTRAQSDAVDAKFRVADVSLGVAVVALGVAAWLYVSRGYTPASAPARAALLDARF